MRLKDLYFRQPNNFTCVPADVKMLLRYYGIEIPFSRIVRECKTDRSSGTYMRDAVRFLKSLGLQPKYRKSVSLSQVRQIVDQGHPIIAPVHWDTLYPHDKNLPGEIETHVVLVIHCSKNRVYFLDSCKSGSASLKWRTNVDFKEAWDFCDNAILYI